MKWILNMDIKYNKTYIISNIFLIFFDSIGFLVPILIGYLVDSVTIYNDYSKLLYITITIIIFVIFKTVGAYLSVIKLDMTVNRMVCSLREKCYKNLNRLDYYFFEHKKRGELMTNFTLDLNQIKTHVAYNIKTIGAIVISFGCSLAYLLTINIPFTIILLTPGVLVGITSYKFLKKASLEHEKARNLAANSNEFISDNIEANKIVKTFTLEQDEIEKMKEVNKLWVNKNIDIALMESKFYMQVDFLSYLMNIIFLLVGGILFIYNQITMGELIIFNAYLYNLRAPFTRLSGLLNSVQRYKVSKARIDSLINAKPKIVLNGQEHIDNLLVPIVFKNVHIVYDKKIILENLNLQINPYETIAFIGKVGSGKSSIVNMLLGFITPKSGEILINGKNYLDYDIKDIRKKIGYVAQQAFLFSDSIYNNIKYGNTNLNKEEAMRYASIACCDYIEKLPYEIDTLIGERGVGLSGGEKQRLSLARAIAVCPDILLLDDITSALDIETEEKINESINNLMYKSTKIIIASKIVSVKNADRIYVLDEGKVIESGTHEELLKQKGYYYELYKIQKGE